MRLFIALKLNEDMKEALWDVTDALPYNSPATKAAIQAHSATVRSPLRHQAAMSATAKAAIPAA